MIEKYLEIDDFVEYIFKEGDMFVELDESEQASGFEDDQSAKSKHSSDASSKDEETIRHENICGYIMSFMRNV